MVKDTWPTPPTPAAKAHAQQSEKYLRTLERMEDCELVAQERCLASIAISQRRIADAQTRQTDTLEQIAITLTGLDHVANNSRSIANWFAKYNEWERARRVRRAWQIVVAGVFVLLMIGIIVLWMTK